MLVFRIKMTTSFLVISRINLVDLKKKKKKNFILRSIGLKEEIEIMDYTERFIAKISRLTEWLLFDESDQRRGPNWTLKKTNQGIEDPSAVVFVVHSNAIRRIFFYYHQSIPLEFSSISSKQSLWYAYVLLVSPFKRSHSYHTAKHFTLDLRERTEAISKIDRNLHVWIFFIKE